MSPYSDQLQKCNEVTLLKWTLPSGPLCLWQWQCWQTFCQRASNHSPHSKVVYLKDFTLHKYFRAVLLSVVPQVQILNLILTFYFLCFCFLSLFLLPSKKFTCWQIPAIVPGWLWQLWAACCLPQRQLDQLPRPHNAMNGIRQDAQMMMMITIILTSSKQLVYQSDPDPTQLVNLNKTIWTQLRYSLLWSWKMRKVALRSF